MSNSICHPTNQSDVQFDHKTSFLKNSLPQHTRKEGKKKIFREMLIEVVRSITFKSHYIRSLEKYHKKPSMNSPHVYTYVLYAMNFFRWCWATLVKLKDCLKDFPTPHPQFILVSSSFFLFSRNAYRTQNILWII